MRHEDFDQRFEQRRNEFDRDFEKAKRTGKIVALILFPLYVVGALLVLGLLAVALYGLSHYVGLI